MSALGGKASGGDGMNPTGTIVGIVIILVSLGLTAVLGASIPALIGIIIGGALIGFGVHFVPVGGAPAAMGQAPGIATGVAMLAAGAGLAGLFGGAWAFESTQGDLLISILGGAVGGGLMMAITCLMVNATYVFAMGIPAASGKVAKDPITGDSFPEYKSQGTEGHGLPFISFVGGVIGGVIAGLGGTLIYLMLLEAYAAGLTQFIKTAGEVQPLAISLAGIFAIGLFLVNAVLAAYNITGTIEGPHDPKFKRVPRAVVGCAVASAFCGLISLLLVVPAIGM
jgi:tetrahydromethanopterin S-methyltransferase subunit D